MGEMGAMPNMANMGFAFGDSARQPRQGQTVQHKFFLSLEELYAGTTKSMKVSRKRLNADGRTTKTESTVLKIDVKRGWKSGTKITFPREGDELPGVIPSDIQFIVGEKPHAVFERDGNYLVLRERVSLKDA